MARSRAIPQGCRRVRLGPRRRAPDRATRHGGRRRRDHAAALEARRHIAPQLAQDLLLRADLAHVRREGGTLGTRARRAGSPVGTDAHRPPRTSPRPGATRGKTRGSGLPVTVLTFRIPRHGGCSSGVERRIVDPEVAGSKPVTHPISRILPPRAQTKVVVSSPAAPDFRQREGASNRQTSQFIQGNRRTL